MKVKYGVNESLLSEVRERVRGFLKESGIDFVEVEDTFSFRYGTVTVNVEVVPWHEEDVLVKFYSYLAEDVNLNQELMRMLLELNSHIHIGAFAIGTDNSVVFRYAMSGTSMNLKEFSAVLYSIAGTADSYDEYAKAFKGSRGAID